MGTKILGSQTISARKLFYLRRTRGDWQMVTEKPSNLTNLLRFFIPLAITWTLMMFTHTIISAGLARTVEPTISTAAYAVALSLAAIFEAPLVMLRQTGMALISSRQSFLTVRLMSAITLLVSLLLVLSIAYIPILGNFVFQSILGVSDELLAPTISAFRVTMWLPLVGGLRCFYQSLILINQKTTYISIGMFVRVGFMVILIFGFTNFHWVVGPLVGAITLVSGIFIEAVNAYWFGRKLIPEGETTLSSRAAWAFYLPLIASSLFVAIGKPFINAGLARMPDAAISLAAFNVASSLAWVLISPSQNVHQVTMVFARKAEDRPLVQNFTLAVATISTALLMGIAFSPLGRWFLSSIIQVPLELVEPTLWGTRILAFFPIIICWLEYNTGLLLIIQATGMVGMGKTFNLITTIAFVLLLAPHMPGAIAAPMAQLIGFISEGLAMQLGLSRQKHRLVQKVNQP